MANSESIGARGIATRFVLAVLVVFLTFNPWRQSFFHWAVAPVFAAGGGIGTVGPVKVLGGLLLLVGWIVCVQATRRSLGVKGALLVLAVLGAVVWLLYDRHILRTGSNRTVSLIILILLSAVLAIGMSWSHLSRKLTGQVDTDQVA
jgi:hypothetical protein